MSDQIHRFIFDNYGIRGELVNLTDSVSRMLEQHNYPPEIAQLLQQAAAVNALLATTIKFEGKISLQLQTSGALKTLVVQTTHKLGFRGLARYDQTADYTGLSFSELITNGQLAITIEPNKGNRYQGIVPLEGNNLAECVEVYFNQSEQLKTRIWLFDSSEQTFGLMLQALPDMLSEESFEHLVFLASTLTAKECFAVDGEVILQRLFHQESIRNFSASPIHFQCGCSRQKMLDSLKLLPETEIAEIIQEKGHISMRCEFCLNQFKFTDEDVALQAKIDGNQTRH